MFKLARMAVAALAIAAVGTVTACGSKSGSNPAAPSSGTSSVTVTVNSPIRMGQTAQATGTAALANGQTQSITSGWQSDQPAIAAVTTAGVVSGLSNGRATIFVVSGGRQGQQVVRVLPDYQGRWTGGLRVVSVPQSGAFWITTLNFCGEFAVGSVDGYNLSLTQSGELNAARLDFGPQVVFPSVAASILADGSAPFSATFIDPGTGLIIEATATINSGRVGELTGTMNEIWRVPGVAGEARLVQDIVQTTRTSTTPQQTGASMRAGKIRVLTRMAAARP